MPTTPTTDLDYDPATDIQPYLTDVSPPQETERGARIFTAQQIDQQTKSLELCGKGCLVGTHVTGTKIRVFPLYCHRWDCPTCGPKKRKLWFARLMSGKPERLITVTHRPTTDYGPEEATKRLKRTWSRFADNQRRKGRECEYAWCVQYHKNGFPHLHILQRGSYIPQSELSLYFRLKLNSPIVDIRRNKSKNQAAAYIIRYILRAAESDSARQPKGFRIQTSMNYCLEWDDRQIATCNEEWDWKYNKGTLSDTCRKILREHGPQHYRITERGAVEFFDFVEDLHLIPYAKSADGSTPRPPPKPPVARNRTLWPDDVIPGTASLD